ncbi:MAG: DUF2285 domain-containing protein [Alphaproteobacteria bacterium]|nr:DUF2285 domain-containing protein [Alphaproteobacteria bacterium]
MAFDDAPIRNRTDYNGLLALPYSGWAWEFKRRDSALRRDARVARTPSPIMLRREDGSCLIRLPRRSFTAEAHGLHFLPDPAKSALEVTPFWLPDVMTANLEAAAQIGAALTKRDEPLRWQDIPGDKTILMMPQRRPKLVIRTKGYAVQLSLNAQGAPIPHAIYISVQLGASQLLRENLRHLEEFVSHCCGAKLNCRPRRGYSPKTLRDALIALDGSLEGASQREIAGRIFGERQASEDWGDGVLSLKSRTRRLIRKGRALMESEYLNLL